MSELETTSKETFLLLVAVLSIAILETLEEMFHKKLLKVNDEVFGKNAEK